MSKGKPRRFIEKDFRSFSALLYLFPALIVVAIFVFYPFSQTIITSLHKTNALGQTTTFIGLANYTYIFNNAKFINSLVVTLKFAIMVVTFSILISFVLAVVSNEKTPGQKFFRLIFSVTMAVSSAVAASVFSYLFHPSMGMLNALLGTQIQWLQSSKYALVSVAAVTIWLNTGMFYIFMLSGLQSISPELYESAEIDGAGFFKKHYHIHNNNGLRDQHLPLFYPDLKYDRETMIKLLRHMEDKTPQSEWILEYAPGPHITPSSVRQDMVEIVNCL